MADGSALPVIPAREIERFASELDIINHETGARSRWKPNDEQRAAWRKAEVCKNPIIYKPRAIGISTAFDLDDALWTLVCDSYGHRVRCGICLDTDDKAKERIKQIVDFLHQLGADYTHSTHSVTFPKAKAEIVAFSAGGERPAASTQFQRVRWSERGFYSEDAEASMGPSIGLAAREVTETTIKADGKNAATCKRLWRDPRNESRKLFFSVQAHSSYRSDPDIITDDEWVRMQAEGFSDRAAAAWFLTVGVEKCGGSELRAYHEYPQREEHLFQAGADRIIRKTPPIAPIYEHIEVHGVGGEKHRIEVYGVLDAHGQVQPWEPSNQIMGAIDTAYGIHKSNSVIKFADKRDCRILASMSSKTIKPDDLARVAQMGVHFFSGGIRRVQLIVEMNGVGQWTCHELDKLGVPYETIDQSQDDNKEQCIVEVKRAIEGEMTPGDSELAEECDSLHKDEKGRLVGYKDNIMTYGMMLVKRRRDGFDNPIDEKERRKRVYFADAMKQERMRRARKPGWGV
jgi:hypothetical protein